MSEDLMIDDIEDQENQKDLAELQQKLIQRCKSAGIEIDIREEFDSITSVSVGIPNGRDKRWTPFLSSESINEILNIEFEKYHFLGDFIAIADYSENSIEAVIEVTKPFSTSMVKARILRNKPDNKETQTVVIEESYLGRTIKIEIGEVSDALNFLSRNPFSYRGSLSIKISGIDISQHNQCLQILKKISDSLFFQFDLQHDVTLSVARYRRNPFSYAPGAGRRRYERAQLQFPQIELDEGPISLYWYGRKAVGMPLLQFLAFYQVIEYYYPTYSQEQARTRIRSILKDPTFRTDRDGDIGKILASVSGHGRGFGDERSQLRATINACINTDDLRGFLVEDDERAKFFSTKQKGLTDHKLLLNNSDADLRVPVADLIYDIRCKIVHTKGESSDGEVELLLPFSKEAELLFFDIELMQYVARKVLISAGAPLSL